VTELMVTLRTVANGTTKCYILPSVFIYVTCMDIYTNKEFCPIHRYLLFIADTEIVDSELRTWMESCP